MSVQPGPRYDAANEAAYRQEIAGAQADLRRRVGETEIPTPRDLGVNTGPIVPAASGRFFLAASPTQMTVGVPTGGRPGLALTLIVENSGGAPWTLATDPALILRSGWVAPNLAAGARYPLTMVCLGAPGWMVF